MRLNEIINGDTLDVLKTLPDASVDCVITSPPYWQLRHYEGIPDYVWGGDESCEHDFDVNEKNLQSGYSDKSNLLGFTNPKTKGRELNQKQSYQNGYCNKCGAWKGQLGLEPRFELYLEHLWMVMDEVYRVLKDEGTVWVNLGDTYGSFRGKSGNGADSFERGKGIEKQETPKYALNRPATMSAKYDKCLLMIPHRFAIGCTERGWVVRNDITWAKRNGMPESVRDRFSKKHEYFFFMVKQKNYYFDLDSIREEIITKGNRPNGPERNRLFDYDSKFNKMQQNTKIPAEKAEQHGSPRARYHRTKYEDQQINANSLAGKRKELREQGLPEGHPKGKNPGDVSDFWDIPTKPSSAKHYATFNTDLIEKPIKAGCPKGGIVLDPFCGTATTLIRAKELGRNYIGIDGSKEYCELAKERIDKHFEQGELAI